MRQVSLEPVSRNHDNKSKVSLRNSLAIDALKHYSQHKERKYFAENKCGKSIIRIYAEYLNNNGSFYDSHVCTKSIEILLEKDDLQLKLRRSHNSKGFYKLSTDSSTYLLSFKAIRKTQNLETEINVRSLLSPPISKRI